MPAHFKPDSGDIWPERRVQTARAFRGMIVAVAGQPGVYEFARTGTPAASLVANPAGGYDLVPGDLTGTGVVAFIGDSVVIY